MREHIRLAEKVYFVGAQDWDRKLFDELIPLPDGTSYNAYIIQGSQKTALIDSVDPTKKEVLFENLKELGITKIDYVISNHAEQDHSGAIFDLLSVFEDAVVVTNPKCKEFLMDLLLIPEEKFMTIEDGQTLSLGDKTLKFIYTPWVHWPETMSTYLVEDKILFSCDLFGSHKASSHLFVKDNYKVIEDAKRYYAEIMMPFRNQVKSNLSKLLKEEIKMIAPSHGPVYKDPSIIIEAYKDWISDRVENKVLIPYVSMHGSTKKIVDYLTKKFTQKGIDVLPINLTVADIGMLAMELVDAATIIVATPFVLAGAHPTVVSAVYLVNALRPKVKHLSIVTSFGWGGKCVKQLTDMLSGLKAEFIEPVSVKGYPKQKDFVKLDELVETVYRLHKEKGLI